MGFQRAVGGRADEISRGAGGSKARQSVHRLVYWLQSYYPFFTMQYADWPVSTQAILA